MSLQIPGIFKVKPLTPSSVVGAVVQEMHCKLLAYLASWFLWLFFFFSTQHISALFVKSPPVYCLCDSAGTTDLKCSHDSDLLCGMTRGKQQEETWGLKITAVSSREATETAKGCFIPLPLIRALPHQQALT